jgi:cytochrome bd ubiquinol oxidase subunit I
VATSLLAFIAVYFAAFGAGTFYILRLMLQAPKLDEPDIDKGLPQRAAGITPAPALSIAAGSQRE